MATGLRKVGDTQRLYFQWLDDNDAPLTTLSPAPTLDIVTPAGVKTTNSTPTQLGSTEFWYYDLVGAAVGVYTVTGVCTDTDVAVQRTETLAVEFSTNSIGDIQAKTDTIGSVTVNVTSPMVNDADAEIVQGATYSAALGNRLTFTFTNVPDTTGGTASYTIWHKLNNSIVAPVSALTVELGTWSGGTVPVYVSLTAAQSASIPSSADQLYKDYAHEVKIALAASAGTIIPVALVSGDLRVYKQAA